MWTTSLPTCLSGCGCSKSTQQRFKRRQEARQPIPGSAGLAKFLLSQLYPSQQLRAQEASGVAILILRACDIVHSEPAQACKIYSCSLLRCWLRCRVAATLGFRPMQRQWQALARPARGVLMGWSRSSSAAAQTLCPVRLGTDTAVLRVLPVHHNRQQLDSADLRAYGVSAQRLLLQVSEL